MKASEIKDLWVAALRSGEYKQGVSRLRSMDDSFCCLGVLCDIGVKHKLIDDNWKPSQITQNYTINGNSGGLSFDVQKQLKFKTQYGERLEDKPSLISLNDLENCTFKEIADVIEAEWMDLFYDTE